MEGCYWDYVRFYVPEDSRLLEVEKEPLPPGSLLSRNRFAPLGDAGPTVEPVEGGKSVFGLFFDLPPGQEREVRLAWQMPAETVRQVDGNWHYRLLVQKQSGTGAIPLRVEATLPPGSQIVSTNPDPVFAHESFVVFESRLNEDQLIEVVFRGGSDVQSGAGVEHALSSYGEQRP
jgi:hypothetical protein